MADARSPWQPPAGVSPERLFRRLLQRPRPWAPVVYPAAPAPLHVRALTPYEVACALDADAPEGLPKSAAADSSLAGLVAVALWEGPRLAFASPDDIGRMPQREWTTLLSASLSALYGVMPSRAFCSEGQWKEWEMALDKGAKHGSNATETMRIASCYDVAVGFAGIARHRRPDRYFGMPVADLTEGQQLAFDTAYNLIETMRQKR